VLLSFLDLFEHYHRAKPYSECSVTTLDKLSLRPSFVDIDLDALGHNLAEVRRRSGQAKVISVVKANAYGHGLIRCALELEKKGTDALAVAFVEEGIQLREAGVKCPILVLGGVVGSQLSLFLKYDLEITASSLAKLEAIEQAAREAGKKARVHLKIDTGMERVGVHDYSAGDFLKRAAQSGDITVAGIYSQFWTGSKSKLRESEQQLKKFLACCDQFEQFSGSRPLRHISKSATLLTIPESALDAVRPGLLLYGMQPERNFGDDWPFKPVMSVRSQVVFFKVVKAGAGVSYEHTWTAENDTRVVTVPIGYGDGYPRRLSNRGSVIIGGKKYPIIGLICMDQLMVDIGQDSAFNGDEVVLLGEQGGSKIDVCDLAEHVDTTPHEITVAMNMRLPRRYWKEGREFQRE
jgi:alanine racemase